MLDNFPITITLNETLVFFWRLAFASQYEATRILVDATILIKNTLAAISKNIQYKCNLKSIVFRDDLDNMKDFIVEHALFPFFWSFKKSIVRRAVVNTNTAMTIDFPT